MAGEACEMAYRWSNEEVIEIGDEQVAERGVGGMKAPDQLEAVVSIDQKFGPYSEMAPVLIAWTCCTDRRTQTV